MKYEGWLDKSYSELDRTSMFQSVSVPVKALESLLEDNESLENYVKYLTDSNEYLGKTKDFYSCKADKLEIALRKVISNPDEDSLENALLIIESVQPRRIENGS